MSDSPRSWLLPSLLVVAALCAALWWIPSGPERPGRSTQAGQPAGAAAGADDRAPHSPQPAGAEALPEAAARVPGALAAMAPLQPGEVENAAAIELLERWSRNEPAAAIQYAAQHPELHGRMALPADLLIGWLDADEAAARRWVAQLPKGALRSQLLPAVISLVAGQDPHAALKMAGELTGEDRMRALGGLFGEWAASEPAAAAAAAMKLQEDPHSTGAVGEDTGLGERSGALQQVVAKWAERDLEAALAWGKRMPPERFGEMWDVLAGKWAEQEPMEAARYLMASDPGANRSQLLATVARKWAGNNPAEALQWAGGLERDSDRELLAGGVLAAVAEADPKAAADLAASLPPGPVREKGLGLVLEQWAAREGPAMAAWVNAQPAGAARDSGCAVLASHLATTDPASAAKWAQAIGDAKRRSDLLEELRRANAGAAGR